MEPFTETWDATHEGAGSIALNSLTGKYEGSEDCLFLNVYTKNLDPSSKFPVIVYIHGGAYKSGSGSETLYGPDFLLTQDILLVAMNYRLGPLGNSRV